MLYKSTYWVFTLYGRNVQMLEDEGLGSKSQGHDFMCRLSLDERDRHFSDNSNTNRVFHFYNIM